MNHARTTLLGATLLAAVLMSPHDSLADDQLVIPPGQEELLADMLGRGATLPGECRFDGGKADGPTIRSTYKCPEGEVVVELLHPSNAPPDATRTERFAIVVRSGSPPAGMLDGLASTIRARETAFQWKPLLPTAMRSSTPWVWPAAALLLGIVIVGWSVRRRRLARRTPPAT